MSEQKEMTTVARLTALVEAYFEEAGDVVKGRLEYGVMIGGKLQKEFELKQSDVGIMIDAEEFASADKPVAYHAALASRQLTRLGDVPGPIEFEVMRRLHPFDYQILYAALKKVDSLGKLPSSDASASTP